VPTGYIIDDTSLSDEVRLSCNHDEMMIDENYKKIVPFCTWKEICEMTLTGLVEVASHGVFHQNLLKVDKETCIMEISKSKKIIKLKTGKKPTSFVYPYGKYNKEILNLVNKHYLYSFSIGRFVNLSFDKEVVYRIYADEMPSSSTLLSVKNKILYSLLSSLLYFFPSIRDRV
jgi:peptidoglycan/xylan/chitin deacetylase (PgdA/CDA1 family)